MTAGAAVISYLQPLLGLVWMSCFQDGSLTWLIGLGSLWATFLLWGPLHRAAQMSSRQGCAASPEQMTPESEEETTVPFFT